jgi:aryl-alcohol dehydrogenase-like predicted oxidoreductase
MEYRHLGASGFKVPVLSFGTGTFGGKGEFFEAWGATDVAEARRLIDICLDAGVSMFDSADIYSSGSSEAVLGEAIKGKRDKVIISTKATFRFDDGPNSVGSSRFHLIQAVYTASTRRHRWPKCCRHSTTSCGQARSAIPACRIFPAGI